MEISWWYQCYHPHQLRDSVLPSARFFLTMQLHWGGLYRSACHVCGFTIVVEVWNGLKRLGSPVNSWRWLEKIGSCFKLLEMACNSRKWLLMAGDDCKGLKKLHAMVWNSWKGQEWLNIALYGWTWLEMTEFDGNKWKYLESYIIGSKWA